MSKIQIKMFQSGTSAILEIKINEFLNSIHIADFLEIKYTADNGCLFAFIRYLKHDDNETL